MGRLDGKRGNAPAGRIVLVTAPAEKLFGFDRKELVGQAVATVYQAVSALAGFLGSPWRLWRL